MSTVLQKLLDDYVMGTISPEDRQRLLSSLRDPVLSEEVKALLLEDLQTGRYDSENIPEIRERLHGRLSGLINSSPPAKLTRRVHFLKTAWFKYAAAILIALGSVIYLLINTRNGNELAATNTNKRLQTDIPPGGEKATLTLADGSKIILDNAANGSLAQQGNAQVVKLSNGQIAYNLKGLSGKVVMWNTMTTPAGGQYRLTLPDGTRVWLNAASSITYPTAFVDNKRPVKISGEVYFEVAKDKEKPFIVDVDGKSSAEVLGTSFNINSYRDEGTIKTTLLEGSVKVAVAASSDAVLLKPGQQAVLRDTTSVARSSARQPETFGTGGKQVITVSSNPDIEQTLAWKDGLFNFNGSDLRAVMRQLERWYDIKVTYEGSVPRIIFKGGMDRKVNLSDVLEFFTEMGLKFRMDGKTLIVTSSSQYPAP